LYKPNLWEGEFSTCILLPDYRERLYKGFTKALQRYIISKLWKEVSESVYNSYKMWTELYELCRLLRINCVKHFYKWYIMPILLEKGLESVYYPKIWITVHPIDTNSRS